MLEALRVASTVGLTVFERSRGPCDEALPDSTTPTGGSGRRMQIGDGKSEIRNPKSEIYSGFARLENVTTKTHSAIKVTVPMSSPGMPSKA